MNARKMLGMVAVAILLAGGAAMGQTHAPWPTNWNNWNDPALWVTVGNAGNAGELSGPYFGIPERICGAVAYDYRIGKFEVTAGQYTAFLNAVAKTDKYGLYNASMDTSVYGCQITRLGTSGSYTYDFSDRPGGSGTEADWANRPVNYVSWGDAIRFANWLTNGQPIGAQGPGTTEDGSYNLNGAVSGAALATVVVPSTAQRATWSNGDKPYFLLISEDEWYKAAYHDKNAGLAATYFDYPTSTNSAPGRDMTEATNSGNNANYHPSSGPFPIDLDKYTTLVGEFELSDSPYGTFDQGGNVAEWIEALMGVGVPGMRGGCFGGSDPDVSLLASYRSLCYQTNEDELFGFRVSVVPEPATLSLLALGGLAVMRRRCMA